VDAKKTADLIERLDYEELVSKRGLIDTDRPAMRSHRLFKLLVIFVCGWSLLEAPLELGVSIDATRLLALAASKLLFVVIGVAAIANVRVARGVLVFICGASVFAIAPALPLEYNRSVAIAIFSTVECLGKAACVVSAIVPLRKRAAALT
jgi:hypothetical protein